MAGIYDEVHARSLTEPDAFWGEAAEELVLGPALGSGARPL